MIKVAICDNEGSICDQLEDILYDLEVTIMGKFDIECYLSGEELCQALNENNYYDIIFLDIELKLLNGVEVGKIIRNDMTNETTQIVYISSNESYAMQLFKIRPLDFIIKPLNHDKIKEVLDNAFKIIKKNNNIFEYKVGHMTYKVPVKEILYFESSNRTINIVTTNGVDMFYGILENVLEKVPYFVYIHKSYLVNLNYITKVEFAQVTMSNNVILPISKSNRKQVRDLLLQLERNAFNYE